MLWPIRITRNKIMVVWRSKSHHQASDSSVTTGSNASSAQPLGFGDNDPDADPPSAMTVTMAPGNLPFAPTPSLRPSEAKQGQMSHLQLLVLALRESLSDLGSGATPAQLESWACLIHESMSVYGRYFHSVQHVFDVAAGADAVQTISALFHDCIYYNVDGGFLPKQREMLEGVLTRDGERYVLSDVDRDEDPMVAMVCGVFGFEPGTKLCPPSFSGENEFLSAVLAVRCMERTLTPAQLFRIAACIEMTIPFRGRDGEGRGPAERLLQRLARTNEEFGIGLGEDELVETTQLAVDVGNRDVGNFESTDRPWFLDNTWKLLPESNIPLRHKVTYTIYEYQRAVRNMERFFAGLQTRVVFNEFQGFPHPQEISAMRGRCDRNIEVARRYIRAKLMSLSAIAALAELTGGDAPMALFVGDLPTQEHHSLRLDDYIDPDWAPDGKNSAPTSSGAQETTPDVDAEVYELLKSGRKHDSKFDLRNSPMAAYLYGILGDAGVERSLEKSACPMTTDAAVALLESIPRGAVEKLVVNCAKIAITRADTLLEVFQNKLRWEVDPAA